jgi:hypothetical protein
VEGRCWTTSATSSADAAQRQARVVVEELDLLETKRRAVVGM